MARSNVYDAVSREAHQEARSVARGVLQECLDTEDMSEDTLHDAIYEAVDSALIYTSDQWCFAWGLPDADDACSTDDAGTFDSALTAKAYENLREYVETSPAMDAARALIEAREAHDEDDEDVNAVADLKEAREAVEALLKEG